MMTSKTPRETHIDRPFRGRVRRFMLGHSQMCELERETGFGIGETVLRVSSHRFNNAEILQTIRLGLEGGGTSTIEATAILTPCFGEPLADFTDLATEILAAAVYGVAPADEDDTSEAPTDEPADSEAA